MTPEALACATFVYTSIPVRAGHRDARYVPGFAFDQPHDACYPSVPECRGASERMLERFEAVYGTKPSHGYEVWKCAVAGTDRSSCRLRLIEHVSSVYNG